ncbi:MAG TPA: trypsin-like peptidase domain-containing protein [bacterium]|nr:trypsin-like peptidase domain-containing protein [bacterium]
MTGLPHRRRSFAAFLSWSLVAALSAVPIASAAPTAPSIQEIYRKASPAVVFITQVDASGKTTSLASGFLVSPNGVIVTNHHVIDPDQGAVHIRVKVPRGDVFTDVRVIYAEPRRDFAVITIKATGLPALPVGDSDKVEVGDRVIAIGNPKGLELTLTEGIVESIRLDPQNGYRFIQHQAPISPGSSGGPLINTKGEVIGINAFGVRDAQNLNGAIPINYVKPYFNDTAKLTWEEWVRTAAGGTPPPRPAAPPAPAPAQPAPGQPAPAAPRPAAPPAAGAAWTPRSFFEHVADFRSSADPFRLGYAAGMYDAVSMFAAAAQGAGLSSPAAVGLFQCIDEKGDRLGQLSTWLAGAAQDASDSTAVVAVVVRACQRAFAPGSFFAHVSDFKRNSDDYRLGFAAGLYDSISLFATAAQDAGIDTQRAIALFKCLDGKGDVLADLTTWVTGAARGGADRDSTIGTVVRACEQ